MAQSPEFPELRWVPPKSFNFGRVAGQPTVVVIHDTEGSEGKTSAEDGAAYDQRRTDGTSTHFFVDADSVIHCVRTTDRANHARATGNKIGIGFELCGRASQTTAQWRDGGLDLRLAAKYVAKCCRKYSIPVRRLSVAQLRAGQKGIAGHVDITNAFGESTHTDPGPNFPWSEFLTMVSAELNPPEDDVNEPQNNALSETWAVADALRDGTGAATAASRPAGPVWLVEQVKQMRADLAALAARPPADVDEQALAQALAPLLHAGITVDEAVAAVKQALREGAGA